MGDKYNRSNAPQFRILSDVKIEKLHLATLQILEKTGVTFSCQEALDLLGNAGADVSNPNRVKIPSYLIEQAIETAPKSIALYTREGEPAFVLNATAGSHFGAMPDSQDILDPRTQQRRPCYADDVAATARLIDALPNIEWLFSTGCNSTELGDVAEKVSVLQAIMNTMKPVACAVSDVSSFREVLKICNIIAGGEERLRDKPFLIGASEPVTPLIQGKNALEKSLLCAEKGIPNFVFSMPMAGATTPASLAGALVLGNAECLSQLVVLQLKQPGAPVIFGSLPSVMDMRTTIFSYGAPELSLIVAALTEMSRYYRLPMFGTAGPTDARIIGVQAATEITYQVFMALLSGANLVHDVGLIYHATMQSPELTVLTDEIIDMVKVVVKGFEINEETLPLNLIDHVGPGGNYVSETHTLKHFRDFWMPTIFDRSLADSESRKDCETLLNEKTLRLLDTHQPKPLSEDLIKEIKKVEKAWFDQSGLDYVYPKKEQS